MEEAKDDPWHLVGHVPEAVKWTEKIISKYPAADREVALISVWLHDSAHYEGDWEVDHAVKSENKARKFLQELGPTKDKIDKICHCIRAHRCRDVLPQTIEAKIVACADSASHMTDILYIDMIKNDKTQYALEKLERDYRDLSAFPDVKNNLAPVYEAWKRLIISLADINI